MILQRGLCHFEQGFANLKNSLLSKRTIVNVHRNKLISEHKKIVEGGKVNELFEKLREENEKLDEKYRYASQTLSLDHVPDKEDTLPTNENYYSLENTGALDEPMKERIYSEKRIPKDKHGIPLHYTWDPKVIYTACNEFSWRNYTPVDSRKYTHSYISGKSVVFKDGVEIKINADQFVRKKLMNFLSPKQFDLIVEKKISTFKNGGRGASARKGNKRYGNIKLTLAEIQEIKGIQQNFHAEFQSEIDFYNNNHMNDPTLKKPQLDLDAISQKYNLPVKAILKILNSSSVDKYRPEHLAERLKKDEKLLKRRAKLSEN